MTPTFFHAGDNDIPSWKENGISLKLIAGEVLGKKSPVPVYSPLYLLELKSTSRQVVSLGKQLFGENGIYILEGSIESEGNRYEPKQLLVAKEGISCEFTMNENSTIYVFGGEPFPEERFIYWNFVSSDKDLIERAKTKWRDQNFARVPGETDFVPLPDLNRNVHSK